MLQRKRAMFGLLGRKLRGAGCGTPLGLASIAEKVRALPAQLP